MGRLQNRDESEDLPVIVESMFSGIKANYLLLALVIFAVGQSRIIQNQNIMIKKCERCNHEFSCRSDNILECHCIHVPISEKAQRFLKENFNDCLCNKCLTEVAAMFSRELFIRK